MKDTKIVSVTNIGSVTVVSPHCSSLMDGRDWTPVLRQLRALAEDSEAAHVLLDLEQVEHLSIRVVMELEEFVRDLVVRGGLLRFCALREPLRDIFKLVCLEHLDLGESVPDALPRYVSLLRRMARDGSAFSLNTAN